ncbi:hypothetical protein RJ641_011586 [Dillenia turbinata]|uniref:Uncharacterized protein n=1 Tax=Dillenia turbinata TaxID=194707 RepID=A0AAN8Z3H7_9MAGN
MKSSLLLRGSENLIMASGDKQLHPVEQGNCREKPSSELQMRDEELRELNLEELQQLEWSLEAGLSRVIEKKVAEITAGRKQVPVESENGICCLALIKLEGKTRPEGFQSVGGETYCRNTLSSKRILQINGSLRLLSLEILGATVEGTVLNVEKKYWGGEEGDSVFCMVSLLNLLISFFPESGLFSHALLHADVYTDLFVALWCKPQHHTCSQLMILAACEPIRSDWARGPTVLSEQLGHIIAGPPTCQSLGFCGLMVQGQRLSFIASRIGG